MDPTADLLYSESDLFQNAFQYAAIGMALVGLDGRFLKVNISLCELLGYSEQELKDRTFHDLTHPEDLEADVALVGKLIAGEVPNYRLEKRYFAKSGEIVWVLLAVSMARDAMGAPLFFISQIKDITARKAVEADLRRALTEKEALVAELQRSNSEITDLRSKLLTICAWTKRVRCNEVWMPVDEFLVKELGLNLTHGMSTQAEEDFMKGTE
jgi:PAS domain S-box-containing protein